MLHVPYVCIFFTFVWIIPSLMRKVGSSRGQGHISWTFYDRDRFVHYLPFYVWFFLFDSIWVSILLESCPIEMTSLNVTVLWMLLIFAIIFNCYVRHIFIRLCYFQKMLLLYLRLLTKIYDSKSLLETLSFYHSFFVSTLILIVVV